MIVRPATVSDVGATVRMGRRFFELSGYGEIVAFDTDSFARTVSGLIRSDSGTVLIGEQAHRGEQAHPVGMAAGVLYPSYLNHAHRTGQELFWWVEPAARGHGRLLLDALEAWARDQGAHSFTMGALTALRPQALDALYVRSGYRPMEKLYLRSL